MSISIDSFTPTSAVAPENGVITFVVNATSSLGQSLNYQWQKSDDGIIWEDIPSEIYSNYTTPSLTLAYSGDYYRVKVYTIGTGGLSSYTEYGPDATGVVLTVTTAVTLVFVTPLEPSYNVAAGGTLSMAVECSLTPSNSADQTNVSTISLQWQFSDNAGVTWSNVPASQYTSLTESLIPVGTTGAFVKKSIFVKNNVTTAYNQRRYRIIATSSLATSSSTSSSAVVLIAASITITKQPGSGSDITTCVKYLPSQPTTTGKLKLSADATSSAGSFSNLSYQWYYTVIDQQNPLPSFVPFTDGLVNSLFIATGAQQKTLDLTEVAWVGSVLPVTNDSYGLKFYCLISGTSGETSVYTSIATVIIQQSVIVDQHVSSLSVVEDIYGDIPDRDTYIQAVQNATFIVSLLESPTETPLEGTAQKQGFPITIQWQRKNPGSSIWNNLGSLVIGNATSTYVTPPLKRTIDNGAYYRAEISATNANNIPYYSPNATGAILNVFNWLYISSQPAQSVVFVNQVASFAVSAIASTSTLTISYQWQYKTSPSATWINLTNNAQINGATTNLLIINNVSLSLSGYEYRCVMNTTDTLSSVTSTSAMLIVSADSFTSISSLNDQYLLEFQSLTWTVVAQTASLSAITYQWEKSTNYIASNPSAATWNNIVGATSATYTKGSISTSDAGHYRCKLTSAGGTIKYTNVARLYVTSLNYSITTNFPTTLKILEGQQPASGISGDSISFPYNFSIVANPTIASPTTYQWQYSVDSGANWINYGPSSGYLSSDPDEASFIPQPFNRSQNGIQIRCKVTSTNSSIPGIFYSAVCTVTVDRRFYYNAGPATLVEKAGNEIRLNLNNYQTGGAPAFKWQRNTGGSWSDIVSLTGYSGETSNELVITPSAVTTSINGHKFRCIITLSDQDSHEYFRSGLQKIAISPAGNPTPTAEIALSIQSADLKKAQYSELATRTGAAIGTVVCIPKPDGYTEGKTGDDTTSWLKQATGTSQGMYDTRFPGFVPLGYHSATSTYSATGAQLLDASHCPDLARIMGNVFGGNIVATYITSGYLPPITSSLSNPVSGTFGIPNNAGKKLMGTGSVNNNSSSASLVPRYDPLGAAGGAINTVGSTGGQYNYEKLDQLPPPTQGGPSGGLAGTTPSTPATFTLGSYSTTGWGDDTITDVPTTYTETVNYAMGTLSNSVIASATLHSHSATSFSGLKDQSQAWSTTWSIGTTKACRSLGGEDGEFLPGPAMNSGGSAGYDTANTGFSHRHGISDPTSPGASAEGAGHGEGTGGAGSESLSGSFNQLDSSSIVSSGSAKLALQSNAIWNSNLKFTLQNSDLIPINQKHFRLKYMIKAW